MQFLFICLLVKHLLSAAHKTVLVHPIQRNGVIMRYKTRLWTRCLAVQMDKNGHIGNLAKRGCTTVLWVEYTISKMGLECTK